MQIISRPPQMRHLSDVLSWYAMAEDGVIVTKSAEFMSCFQYHPRDLKSSSPEQLVSARSAMNKAVLRLDKSWCIWFEAQRYSTVDYDYSEWPDPVSRLIDGCRSELFVGEGVQYTTDYVVTLLYAPPDDSVGRLAAQFEHSNAEERSDSKRIANEYEVFRHGIGEFLKHLSGFMPTIRQIYGSELLSYLHSTINPRRRNVKLDPFPLYVSEYLAEGPEFLAGRYPMIGGHHLRSIRITGLSDETTPGVFSELDSLDFPYRRVARWIPFSREDAQKEIEARKQAWANKRVPILRKVMALYVGDDGSRDNLSAKIAMEMADAALVSLSSADFSFGLWTHTVTICHQQQSVLNERLKRIRYILESKGFGAEPAFEDAMSVWVGSLPGHPHGDLGRFLGSSLTFSEILPATAVWEGPVRDEHLDGPAILRGISDGGTPFRMALHQPGSDLGHTLIIGESGAGKSTMLGSMIAGHRRYPGSRIVVIDRGASAKCITLALGGEFHALAAESSTVSLQPLARIHIPEERAWANDFVLGCLNQEGVTQTPWQKQQVTIALQTLATLPERERTISVLRGLVQDHDVKLGLSPFCLGGAYGDLLDNDVHRVGSDADVTCFETTALLDRQGAIGPVFTVLFHEIERKFDGNPLLLCVDEAWSALDTPMIASRLRGYFKTARKNNVAMICATQSLADIKSSSISEVLSESCQNRIFTANSRAMERGSSEILASFGLSKEQIKIISELRLKAEYVFTNGGNWRQFELRLSEIELAFVGRSRLEDKAAMDRIVTRYGQGEFAERWLDYCGLDTGLLSMDQHYASAAE